MSKTNIASFIILASLTLAFFFFFLNDAAPTEFSPLPLPDPLPISPCPSGDGLPHLSLVSLRRLSPQRGGRSLARPPLSLAERLQLLSCDLERARPARTAGAERGGSMFEATQEAKASGASKGLWIVFAVVVVAIAAGGYLFFSKAKANKPFPFSARGR